MKIAVSILLLCLITFQVMLKTYLVLDYRMNKAYIAAVLCENKAKPQMHCDGKCHLKKQISQTEQAESKSLPSSLKEKETVFCQSWYELAAPEKTLIINNTFLAVYTEGKPMSVSNAIFQPPQA